MKSIRSVPVLNDFGTDEMANAFFGSKWPDETLGIVKVPKKRIIPLSRKGFNDVCLDASEIKKFRYWEKHYAKSYSVEEWEKLSLAETSRIKVVAKTIWLCDHLRRGNDLDFPLTFAWNTQYNEWEVIVGTSRITAIKYFYTKKHLDIIKFSTRGLPTDLVWQKTFSSLEEISNYYSNKAYVHLNFRAWNGSLIPGVHFFNNHEYRDIILMYHNKLVNLLQENGFIYDTSKTVEYNLNQIIDKVNNKG